MQCAFGEVQLTFDHLATTTRLNKAAGGKSPHILNGGSIGKNILETPIKKGNLVPPRGSDRFGSDKTICTVGKGGPLAALFCTHWQCMGREAHTWRLKSEACKTYSSVSWEGLGFLVHNV